MYKFKNILKEQALDGRTITSLASKIGVTNGFMTSILNAKRSCSKPIAYCITKCLDKNKEIEFYFERNDENE